MPRWLPSLSSVFHFRFSTFTPRVALAVIAVSTYVTFLLAVPPRSWDASVREVLNAPRAWIRTTGADVWKAAGVDAPSKPLIDGTFFLVAGVAVPWVVMALLRRGRLRDIGCRRPNRFAWRMSLLGYLLAMPFLVWMVDSPGFAKYYMHQLRAGTLGFVASYFANMFAEHFLFHGVMLAAFRVGHRWPDPCGSEPDSARRHGLLRTAHWFGLAQPTGTARGLHRPLAWIGLPAGCVTAVVVSGLLFGWVHLGKDARELFLSVPGGMASAYLAYRTNSWLTPFALHVATAGTACLLMVLSRS